MIRVNLSFVLFSMMDIVKWTQKDRSPKLCHSRFDRKNRNTKR